jgi:hypothetical protein
LFLARHPPSSPDSLEKLGFDILPQIFVAIMKDNTPEHLALSSLARTSRFMHWVIFSSPKLWQNLTMTCEVLWTMDILVQEADFRAMAWWSSVLQFNQCKDFAWKLKLNTSWLGRDTNRGPEGLVEIDVAKKKTMLQLLGHACHVDLDVHVLTKLAE